MKQIIIALVLITFIPTIGMTDVTTDDPVHKLLTIEPEVPDCEVYAYNAGKLIPRLYQDGQNDSIHIVLDFWGERCCNNATIIELQILLAIDEGEFQESDYVDLLKEIVNASPSSYGYFPMYNWRIRGYKEEYKLCLDFKLTLALEMVESTDSGTVEHLVARYLAGEKEGLLRRLREPVFDNTILRSLYDESIKKIMTEHPRSNGGHYWLTSGVWIPTGKASELIGPMVQIGGSAGVRNSWWQYDFTFLFRFLNSKEKFMVAHKGDLVESSTYMGTYTAIEVGFEFIRANRHQSSLFVGLGIDALNSHDDQGDNQEAMNAFARTVGLRYRFLYDKTATRFIGLEGRYSFVEYYTHGGADLSGNSFSINLTWGFTGNKSRVRQLSRLSYYE